MNTQTIANIYADNDKIRKHFNETLAALTDREASSLPEGEKWTISQIVEHVSIVEDGITRLCSKLLSEAQAAGKGSDGTANISDGFMKKGEELARIKVEAPERVHPVGDKTIAESMAKLEENRTKLNELRPLFESCDCNENKFPHPFLGDISAGEWLTLIGGHESRHLRQIKNVLAKIGQ